MANIQSDKTLVKKLIQSNSYLEWIKAIKDRHGSVEESSMTNVTQINESGVYTVTQQGGKFNYVKSDQFQSKSI